MRVIAVGAQGVKIILVPLTDTQDRFLEEFCYRAGENIVPVLCPPDEMIPDLPLGMGTDERGNHLTILALNGFPTFASARRR